MKKGITTKNILEDSIIYSFSYGYIHIYFIIMNYNLYSDILQGSDLQQDDISREFLQPILVPIDETTEDLLETESTLDSGRNINPSNLNATVLRTTYIISKDDSSSENVDVSSRSSFEANKTDQEVILRTKSYLFIYLFISVKVYCRCCNNVVETDVQICKCVLYNL